MQNTNTTSEYISVPLSQGKFAIVSKSDAERVLKHKWYYVATTGYAARNVTIEGKQKTQLLHRFVMEAPEGRKVVVDHVNHDKLNNTRENLRFCSQRDNAFNRKISSNYKGSVDTRGTTKVGNKYIARIGVNWKQVYLGSFATQEEASAAYYEAAKKYFGEFYNPKPAQE